MSKWPGQCPSAARVEAPRLQHPSPAFATAGHHVETIAAQVPLKEGVYFTAARCQIRTAIAEDGVAKEIDELVDELLGR